METEEELRRQCFLQTLPGLLPRRQPLLSTPPANHRRQTQALQSGERLSRLEPWTGKHNEERAEREETRARQNWRYILPELGRWKEAKAPSEIANNLPKMPKMNPYL